MTQKGTRPQNPQALKPRVRTSIKPKIKGEGSRKEIVLVPGEALPGCNLRSLGD